jgi:hypothetical protein
MTFILEKPRSNPFDSFAGGEATIGDIMAADWDSQLYASSTDSARLSMDRAFEERIDEVFAATGVKIEHPMRFRNSVLSWDRDAQLDIADPVGRFMDKVQAATANIPDQAVGEKLMRSIEGDAYRIARDSDEKAAQLFASRPGIGKWLASFATGMAAAVRDPVQGPLLLVGGGPGGARTVAGRILSTAVREAAINGASEAVFQPMVQAWRAKAGLSHGVDQAAQAVLMSTLFGGALGGIGQGIGEAIGRATGRALDVTAEAVATRPEVRDPMRAALAGDPAAARTELAPIREALPAPARGALDAADALDHIDRQRPASATPEHHDRTIAAAQRAIAEDAAPRFEPDAAQVARIADEMAPAASNPAAPRARSLTEFLADRGGVLDHKGELNALGAGHLARKRAGKGKPDKRVSLDYAREAAEEAGYIGRAGEVQTTTVADLLDAIDQDMRGNRVYSREDAPERIGNAEADRARVESAVHRIAREAGPSIDDKTLREAADLMMRGDLDPADALERIYTQQGMAMPPEPARAAEAGGIDEPDRFEGMDAYLMSSRDIAELEEEGFGDIPFFDESPMSAAELKAQLQEMDDIRALVEACRA